MNVVNNLEFDWNKVMEAALEFLKNGAGSMLESTINTAKNIIGAVGTFFIAFVFAMYILLQKRKAGKTGEKSVICICQKGKGRLIGISCIGCAGGSCIDIQDILQFSDGTVCRGSDPGIHVRDCDDAA